MTPKTESISDAITALVEASKVRSFDKLYEQFEDAIYGLVQKEVVHLKSDYQLGGRALEIRVRLILEGMRLIVRNGRNSTAEDWIVDVPSFALNSMPLVIEVKSGRKGVGPTQENLRQLDDWVFELSGEDKIRKRGYIKQDPNRSYKTKGAIQPLPTHPSPHKGVFLYNGPLDTVFEQRKTPMLSPNEKQFAEKRSFCVISLNCLLSWSAACKESSEILKDFWHRVQACTGELPNYGS